MKKGTFLYSFGALAMLIPFLQSILLDQSVTYFYENKTGSILNNQAEAQTLPGSLVIKPGNYQFAGKNYSLQKEGLYRFKSRKETQNRIVFQSDPRAIISGIAWLENNKVKTSKKEKKAEWAKKLLTGEIGLSCGNIAGIAASNLIENGFETRTVSGFNTDAQEGEDFGHTIAEAKINGKWQVFDVDNNVMFKADGRYLNFWELFQKIKNRQPYELAYMAFDDSNKDEAKLREYYYQTIRVPLIIDTKNSFFTAEGEDKEKTQKYTKKYQYLPEKDWLEKYYSAK